MVAIIEWGSRLQLPKFKKSGREENTIKRSEFVWSYFRLPQQIFDTMSRSDYTSFYFCGLSLYIWGKAYFQLT